MHPNRILICIDGSANSNYALDAIAATRWERNQEFCLLTVIEQEHSLNAVRFVGTRPLVRAQKQAVNTAQKALAKQAAQLKMVLPRHKIRTLVHEGTPAQAILDYAREWSADLIILGADVANFKGGRAALGCVAECVVNRAECSVIVARPRQCDTSEGEAVEGATVTSSRPS